MPRLAKLALQADLWYYIDRNIVVPGGAVNTPGRIHLIGDVPMTTLPPHADNGNIPSTSGIYKITCTANKRIYIGSALNLRERRRAHFGALRRNEHINKHLQNAWNKYGPDVFTFEVLEYVLPMSLTAREQYWFNREKPFGRKGFNIAREAGSTLGYKYDIETIEKIRQKNLGRKQSPEELEKKRQASLGNKYSLGHKHTPEAREHMRQAQLGRKQTPEAIEKIRQGHLGKKNTPEHNEKVRQANLGKPQSAETIEKRRQTHLGMKRSPEARERMRQANLARWAREKKER